MVFESQAERDAGDTHVDGEYVEQHPRNENEEEELDAVPIRRGQRLIGRQQVQRVAETPSQIGAFITQHQTCACKDDAGSDEPQAGGGSSSHRDTQAQRDEAGIDRIGKPVKGSAGNQFRRGEGIHRKPTAQAP